jgi:hypothetical protein
VQPCDEDEEKDDQFFLFFKVMEHRWKEIDGENRSTRGKTCPSATLSTTNPTWIDPGSNVFMLQVSETSRQDLTISVAVIVPTLRDDASAILLIMVKVRLRRHMLCTKFHENQSKSSTVKIGRKYSMAMSKAYFFFLFSL